MSPPRVITYGLDETLLMTRKEVLAKAGIPSDVVESTEKFVDCIMSADRKYDICIVCHSVPEGEREVIEDVARDSGLAVYTMHGITLPQDFVAHVKELTGSC